MMDNQSRRDFIKKLAALVAAGVVSPSVFFGAKAGEAPAGDPSGKGNCSSSYECAGGNGKCGSAYNCSGQGTNGQGKCGSSYECAGGGGKCGSAYQCPGQSR